MTHAEPITIGALCWNQYTDWPSRLQAGVRADRLGSGTLWMRVILSRVPCFAARPGNMR